MLNPQCLLCLVFSPIMLPDMKKRTFCGSMPEIFIRELFGRFFVKPSVKLFRNESKSVVDS